jgi:5'-nucleotidase / UDP-sugar diphosphatase
MTIFQTAFRAALCFGLLFAVSAQADDHYVLRRDLDTRAVTTCTSETAFGNFVADAIKKRNAADVALISCAVIRGEKLYTPGMSFTPVAVAFELPDERKTTVIEVSGAQLLDAMEHAVSALPEKSSAFVQVAGLRMDVDPGKPPGLRIMKLTVNGNALDFAKQYRIATTDDIAAGGEGFEMLKSAKPLASGSSIATDVTAYLNDKGVKDIKVLGRIEQQN